MRFRSLLLVALLLLPISALAQPNDFATVQALASEGYFDKCAAGEMRGCSYFARLLAFRLNPTADPNGWGWLSKSSGESNVEGFADDAIVYGQGQNNVIDIAGGSGVLGARVQWLGPNPRRPSNLWVAPRALTTAEMNYLKPGGPIVPPVTPPTPPVPPTAPTNLQPVLDAIAALAARIDNLEATIQGFGDSVLPSLDAQAQRLDRVHQDVLVSIDLGRQQLVTTYSGKVPAFGGSVTLKPNRP